MQNNIARKLNTPPAKAGGVFNVYTVILCIGLWRSANKYTGSFIWIVITKFFSILWMLSIIIFVADIFGLINMQLPGATEDLPQWRLDNYKKSIESLITP